MARFHDLHALETIVKNMHNAAQNMPERRRVGPGYQINMNRNMIPAAERISQPTPYSTIDSEQRSVFVGISSQEHITLLTDYDSSSAYAVAYQELYTNIRFSWEQPQSHHSVLLTTPAPAAGHSAVATNVAIAAAQNGMQTILVDADLAEPSLQHRFGIGEQEGLGEILSNGTFSPQEIAPHLHKTFIPNLLLLCAGKSLPQQDSSRLLATGLERILTSTQQVLDTANQPTSLVIFNSPPVLKSLDATLIAAQVDQAFLFLVTGKTTRSQAKRAYTHLQRAQAKLAGLVMIDIEQ
jgi:capsular exopolysaccharide synthesis family protein